VVVQKVQWEDQKFRRFFQHDDLTANLHPSIDGSDGDPSGSDVLDEWESQCECGQDCVKMLVGEPGLSR